MARAGVDVAPLAVSMRTKLARVAYVMRMLGASSAFVTDEGKLCGVLTRVTLFHVESMLFDDEAEVRRQRQEAKSPPPSARRSLYAPPPYDPQEAKKEEEEEEDLA